MLFKSKKEEANLNSKDVTSARFKTRVPAEHGEKLFHVRTAAMKLVREHFLKLM